MDLSVVIISWNTESLLDDCIGSLYRETHEVALEIIVVDNGSKDGSVQMLYQKYPNVKVIENTENLGFTKACNQGFKIATGEYVLMFNSDAQVNDGALDKMVDFMQGRPSVGILGSKIIYPDGSFQSSCFRYPRLFYFLLSAFSLPNIFAKSRFFNQERYGLEEWNIEKQVECVMGSCLLIRRKILEEVEYMDESFFMYCEETDLCCKVKKHGYEVMFYPEANITHILKGSQKNWRGMAWSHYAVNRGKLLFILKWNSVFIANIANLILCLSVLPRSLAWFALDGLSALKAKKKFESQRLLKLYTYRFNFKALFNPSLLKRAWAGPDREKII